MILYMLALGAANPTVADLRVTGVGATWEICVKMRAEEFEDSKKEPGTETEFTTEMAVEIGVAKCASFENDFRDAYVVLAPEYLRKSGVKFFGPDVVNTLANTSLDAFSSEMSKRVTVHIEQRRRKK